MCSEMRTSDRPHTKKFITKINDNLINIFNNLYVNAEQIWLKCNSILDQIQMKHKNAFYLN